MKFSTIFSVYEPSKKAHPHHEIQAFLDAERHEFLERHNSLALWARETPKSAPERHKFQERHNSLVLWAREMPKSAPKIQKFCNAIILCYLGPENRQIQPQKTRISHRTALIDPSKNANKIRKVFIFPEFRTLFEMQSSTPSTLTKQQLGNT